MTHVNKNKLYTTLTGTKQYFLVKLLDDNTSPRRILGNHHKSLVVVGVKWLAANKPEIVAKLMADKINGKGPKTGAWIGGSLEDEGWIAAQAP